MAFGGRNNHPLTLMKMFRSLLRILTIAQVMVNSAGALLGQDTLQFPTRFVTVSENSGSVSLLVTRVGALTSEAMVDYLTIPLTATPDVDYQAVVGRLTFLAGESNQTLRIPLLDDPIQEGAEGFMVLLINPMGAVLGRGTNASVTIADNEKPFLVDPSFDPGK